MSQNIDAISAFLPLRAALSKLYPLERWAVSTTCTATYPLAPRFCWEFFRADPETLRRLGEALRRYEGSVSWLFGPPSAGAMCLVAAPRGIDQFVGYPPMAELDFLPEGDRRRAMNEDFVAQAVADVSNLSRYLERYFKLEGLVPKAFDPRLTAPAEPPRVEGDPVDFVEPGMHVAWIMRMGAAAGQGHSGADVGERLMLHFSVSADEWQTIVSDILGREPSSFPLLGRIREDDSVYFHRTEIERLRVESVHARAGTSAALAIRGIDKVIMLCKWAQRTGGDLLLRAP